MTRAAKTKATLTTLLFPLLCLSVDAAAGGLAASASVEILPAIDIEQKTIIDFGQLRNTNGTCVMSSGGQLSGSDGMDCTGSETPGAFVVSGRADSIVNVSVSPGSMDGVFFEPKVEGGQSRSLTNGASTITVLGSLRIKDSAPGKKSISYTFTANYN
ncbi:MAG: hypothetical protein AB8B86_13500 [Pseudomonadales bacterium]